ncbi:putative retrotransposon gag domain, aspartic peptidase domain protein [Tanacetum coccineum]
MRRSRAVRETFIKGRDQQRENERKFEEESSHNFITKSLKGFPESGYERCGKRVLDPFLLLMCYFHTTPLSFRIPELFDQDSLFYFLDGLQGWAKTELERQGVQDLSTAIAYAEALIDFSTRRESSKPKDRKVNQEKGGGEKNAQPKSWVHKVLSNQGEDGVATKFVGKRPTIWEKATINGVKVRALVDSGATHNFVADDEAKRLGINATKGSGTIKAVNSPAKPVGSIY